MLIKFDNLANDTYAYGNIFMHEIYPDWSRIKIGVNKEHISLMLEIAQSWDGPFGILYVLVVSRAGSKLARYQSPELSEHKYLAHFANTFKAYFEQDGRHHIWFIDLTGKSQLVYDNHNLIYSYGNDAKVKELLIAKGFKEKKVEIPAPHSHHYHKEFDHAEEEIMRYWDWLEFPLKDRDNP